MESKNSKKIIKKDTRKTIVGIKLPPIEPTEENIKTILDVDPDYYSLVEGRPIKSNKSISQYKKDIKNVALNRAIHGFLVDEIMRIDREIETERDIYETANKHFEEYRNSFDKFLADDNNKTITIMQKSDALAKKRNNQTEDSKKANYELATIKSKLQYIDEGLLILLSFQNFLNKASPVLWQESNNIQLDTQFPDILAMNSNIFEKIDIDGVKMRMQALPPPQLFFETPNQLLTFFGIFEKQNLNYLLALEEFTCEKNKFLKTLEVLKENMKQELDFIQEKIVDVEDMISWNGLREIELKEKFFRILEDKMKYLVSSDKALELFTYVEFAFEHLIAKNETKFSTLDMAQALEKEYDDLILEVSAYDFRLIKQIEKEVYNQEEKDIKQAKRAATLLKDVDKLARRLHTSYEPTRRKIPH